MNAGLYADGAQVQNFHFDDPLSRELFDFEILCAHGSVCVHKLILMTRSLYFRQLLENQVAIREITLEEFSQDVMRKVVRLIYGDIVRVPELQVEEFVKILHFLRVDYWAKFNRLLMDGGDLAAMASTPDISTETEPSTTDDLGSRRSGDGDSMALTE
nr:PREDICTED: uncharacterized protein LOC656601 [Tribolium castaneum]|eukprot:XP_976201.3 PREDICTED: uncharacterized protein LOC656601 [Tribolium castaneum]